MDFSFIRRECQALSAPLITPQDIEDGSRSGARWHTIRNALRDGMGLLFPVENDENRIPTPVAAQAKKLVEQDSALHSSFIEGLQAHVREFGKLVQVWDVYIGIDRNSLLSVDSSEAILLYQVYI